MLIFLLTVAAIIFVVFFFKDMIFEMMLDSRTQNEGDRLLIYKHLQQKCTDEYSEQTVNGNYYNSLIEFNLASDTFRVKKDKPEILKSLSNDAIDDSLKYL